MDYSRADIELAFPERYVDRAYDYQLEGRAQLREVSAGGQRLVGEVSGGRASPYRVEVEIFRSNGEPEFVGSCTCPVGRNCKHVVALLLAGLAGRDEGRSAQVAESLELLEEGGEHEEAFEDWLDEAESRDAWEAESARSPYPSSVRRRLLYVLRAGPRASMALWALAVEPISARLTREGELRDIRPYDPAGVLKGMPPNYVLDEDRRLLVTLIAEGRRSSRSGFQIGGEAAVRFLEAAIETGRACWGSPTARPLRKGAARHAQALWRADERGRQRLYLVPEPPATVVWVTPPWYVDLERDVAGPLETGLSPAVATAIAEAPVIDPAHAEALRARVLERCAALGLPLPLSVEVEEAGEVSPRPLLRLESYEYEDWAVGGAGETALVDIAALSFAYGDEIVHANDPRLELNRREGRRVRRIERDPESELRARERLAGLGFRRVLDELSMPHWTKGYRELRRWDALTFPGGAAAWGRFVLEELPRLREEGWEVEIAPGFRHHLVEAQGWYADLGESRDAWFDLELGIEVDGGRVNLLPVLVNLLRGAPEQWTPATLRAEEEEQVFVPLEDGRLVVLPRERVCAILEALVELNDPDVLRAGRLPAPGFVAPDIAALEKEGWLRWQGGEPLRRLGQALTSFRGLRPAADPPGLRATLREYQRIGLAWAQLLGESGLNGVLADDMGLGKTIQALALLLAEREGGRLDRPSLVVAPTSVLANWRREAARFAPDLRVALLHGPRRAEEHARLGDADLALTSYALLTRDEDELLAKPFHYLILDEAQRVKNRRAKAAQVVRRIEARRKLCLTGTPIENDLSELYALFDFLLPGFLGDRRRFGKLFRTPIEKRDDGERRAQLAGRIGPLVLRRRKNEVARELPPKTELTRTIELHGAQRDLYETVRLTMHERVQQALAERGIARSQIVILDALLKMRQVCCDPRLLKIDAARGVRSSAKLDTLMELLAPLLDEGRRVLLFSQFTSMLALIEEELGSLDVGWAKLTGRTKDREAPIRRFQEGEVPLFLVSLKAGGVGLNLTAADTVIHYDPWWNPAVEDQATDRAHRIGQDKPVFVYRLITQGTVEERILALQESKRRLVEGVIEAGATRGAQLDADDLAALFAPLE